VGAALLVREVIRMVVLHPPICNALRGYPSRMELGMVKTKK
jgi:hypothetical protein